VGRGEESSEKFLSRRSKAIVRERAGELPGSKEKKRASEEERGMRVALHKKKNEEERELHSSVLKELPILVGGGESRKESAVQLLEGRQTVGLAVIDQTLQDTEERLRDSEGGSLLRKAQPRHYWGVY